MTFNLPETLELLDLCEAVYGFCWGAKTTLPEGFSAPIPVKMCSDRPRLLEDDTLDTFGMVTRKAGKTYLVFRGTQKPNVHGIDKMCEWATDFEALPMRAVVGGGHVHCGFDAAWKCVSASVIDALKGDKPIITGHSLGAALATCAWLDLGGQLLTFAGPRVGDTRIADELWQGQTIRVVNVPDVVPLFPTDPPFRHGGQEIKVHGPGDLHPKVAHALESYRIGLVSRGEAK